MGRPKPLLPFGGGPLVGFQVVQLAAAAIDDIVVVVGHEATAVEAAIAGLPARSVPNGAYRSGRASSIRAGAQALPASIEAIVILNVDQPRPAALIRAVIDAHFALGGLITRPMHRGRGGHPTVFAGALLPELRAVEEETAGLRAILTRHRGQVRQFEEPDPRVVLDLNDEPQYLRALASFDDPQSHDWGMLPRPASD